MRAGDPRAGLRRRYTMEEILELNGGRPKIHPLNYDALTMLRNPLYVKFAEEIREKNTEVNSAIRQHQTEDIAMRQMASEQGLPYDQVRQVIERAPDQQDGDSDDSSSEEEEAGSVQPLIAAIESKKRRSPTPDTADAFRGKDDRTDDPGGGGSGSAGGLNTTQADSNLMDDLEEAGRTAAAAPRTGSRLRRGSQRTLDASHLQTMAEIEELRRELRQQQKQQIIIQNMPAPPTNPMREIIREIHQVQTPAPPPVAPQPSEETARLIATLNQAVAQNQNLSAFAERMGMNMNQLVALMRAQLQAGGGPGRGGEVAASSSSGQPPPPPGGYGPVAAHQGGKRRPEVYQLNRPGRDPSRPPRAAERAQPAQVETAPASTASVRDAPRLERSRSEVRGAAATEIVPSRAPVRPSQAPVRPSAASAASRESTVSSMDSQRTIDYRGKELAPPSREASRARSARAASAATIDYRSRSRGADGSAAEPQAAFTLPVKGGVPRGRSPPAQPERMKRIMEDIASSQNKELVKGQMRVELGRFARSFAAKRKEQEKRAVSQPLPPKAALTRTFDELVEEEVQPAPGARSVKQRIASRGGSQSGASRVRSLTARGEGIRAA
jgi:hypothetical protein